MAIYYRNLILQERYLLRNIYLYAIQGEVPIEKPGRGLRNDGEYE